MFFTGRPTLPIRSNQIKSHQIKTCLVPSFLTLKKKHITGLSFVLLVKKGISPEKKCPPFLTFLSIKKLFKLKPNLTQMLRISQVMYFDANDVYQLIWPNLIFLTLCSFASLSRICLCVATLRIDRQT